MTAATIFHLCRATDWRASAAPGAYWPPSAAAEGFIHLSTAAQVAESAARHFAGVADLVLVTVDAGRLGDALKWENSRRGEAFPHLYAPLSPTAVMAVEDVVLGGDGIHRLPFLGQGLEPA